MALDPPQASDPADGDDAHRSSSVVSALSVYVEPLVAEARVAVIGDVELGLHERLLELGARTVHLFDPDPERVARTADEVPRGVSVRMLRDDFDVRDGAFDLVVIPDLGILPDPAGAIVRLRRVVDPRGAVVAMGRARTQQQDASRDDDTFPEMAPAVVDYAELYDLFALQFEDVTMNGVLPFTGVVFAQLGAGDDLAVSVDTRLVDPDPPVVFVVVAGREASALDPYAIVQVSGAMEAPLEEIVDVESLDTIAIEIPLMTRDIDRRDHEVATAFAAMQLKAELLATQLDEHRARLTAIDSRSAEYADRVEQITLERDAAFTRAAELEGVLAAAQQALAILERRVIAAEQGMLERDDQIAALNAELDARTNNGQELTTEAVDPAVVGELVARAERAETSLALHVADLAQLSEAQAVETHMLEEQLRDRARVIAATDKELARREQLVRELVASLEEARDQAGSGSGGPHVFEAAPVMPGVAPEEVARLRRKLDDLALQVARREGELVAQTWRITELENEKARLVAARQAAPAPAAPAARAGAGGPDLERELARTRDELDALRQALTQEHAARIAAESGEELSRARAELARQAALLEQIKGRGTHPEG
ncbi:MAG: response regulator receiver [Myxococcaceae bacterium]|nr:response regulator receiver [Myxococcaceae bacterium]